MTPNKGKRYWTREFYKGIETKKFHLDTIHTLLCILLCVSVYISWTFNEQRLDMAKRQYIFMQKTVKEHLTTLEYQTSVNEMLTKQYESSANRVKELEAVSDKSEIDIVNYILSRYTKTPKAVAKEIGRAVLEKSEEHNVPFVAVIAVIEVESQFNPYAVSKLKKDPARGLMQVRPGIWGETLGLKKKTDLHDIDTGIDAGCRVLRTYLDETNNNMKKALYKYVGGNTEYGKRVYENMGKFVVYRSLN